MEKGNRIITVGIYSQGMEEECDKSLAELERLVDTAGGIVFTSLKQLKNTPDAATFLGSGKIDELSDVCKNNSISQVVFDCELTPSQIRNIEEIIETDVIDRSMLILDIFSLHAKTAEGKVQVELAQLKYTAPRLIGKGKDLSRLGGGIGTRGPGESKLEIDKRRLSSRVSQLQAELESLEKNRKVMRQQRDNKPIPKACIVGYTNAGKSSLLNELTGAGILAEDKLFATLDATTRRFELPSGLNMLITDTVGFIRKLPHHLIYAFRSTLEETLYCDFLIIVVDASDDECLEQMAVTDNLLESLGANNKEKLYVFNKIDKCSKERIYDLRLIKSTEGRVVSISAKYRSGFEELINQLESLCRNGKELVRYLIPFSN